MRFMGVTSALSEGGRVELLFKFAGCHETDECLVMVSVDRASEATLVADLPRALRSAVERHRSSNIDE